MRLSRKRLAELQSWSVPIPTHYCGPLAFGERFCKEGQPFDWDQGFLEDATEWTFARIRIEPLWVIEEGGLGGWVVYERTPWSMPGLGKSWTTRERAEAYLKLLQEDWWDGELGEGSSKPARTLEI